MEIYFGIQIQTKDGLTVLDPSELTLHDNALGAVNYDASNGKLYLNSVTDLDYNNKQSIKVDVGLSADQLKTFNIPFESMFF